MVRIMLACSAGMSTSLLVTKMEAAAKTANVEAEIWAWPEADIEKNKGKFDICLLGPQVRFKLKEVTKKANGEYPVEVIGMTDYGTMNGKAVFEFAMKVYNDFYNK